MLAERIYVPSRDGCGEHPMVTRRYQSLQKFFNSPIHMLPPSLQTAARKSKQDLVRACKCHVDPAELAAFYNNQWKAGVAAERAAEELAAEVLAAEHAAAMLVAQMMAPTARRRKKGRKSD